MVKATLSNPTVCLAGAFVVSLAAVTAAIRWLVWIPALLGVVVGYRPTAK